MANGVFTLLTASAFLLSVVFLILLIVLILKPAGREKKKVSQDLINIREQINGEEEAEVY